ncbi:MAG: hypothetical protein ACO24Y_04320 [Hylemonella sp.]
MFSEDSYPETALNELSAQAVPPLRQGRQKLLDKLAADVDVAALDEVKDFFVSERKKGDTASLLGNPVDDDIRWSIC